MPRPIDLSKLLSAVQAYEEHMTRLEAEAPPGAAADQLRRLRQSFTSSFQHFQTEFAKEVPELHEKIAVQQAQLGALKEKAAAAAAAAHEARAAKKAAKAAPPSPPEKKAIDPGLGPRLRAQLLRESGAAGAEAETSRSPGDLTSWVFEGR